MRRKRKSTDYFDIELDDLPPELRWRQWMGRVEAVIFASPKPVDRETLARIVGRGCNVEALIDDIRAELRDRPYELASVAGGWQHRTRKGFADAIRTAVGVSDKRIELSKQEHLVMTAIAYFQPVTRSELCKLFGRDISRDIIGDLRSFGLVASGPRSPRAGAPYNYVTTPEFLSRFGFESLRDLPEMQALEEAGLLSKQRLFEGDARDLFGVDREAAADDVETEDHELFGGTIR